MAVGAGVPASFAPVGSRVMNHHYKGCGRCKHCRVGWSQLCRAGTTVYGITDHGGHAPERLLIAIRELWRDFGLSQHDRLQLASLYDRLVRRTIDRYYDD